MTSTNSGACLWPAGESSRSTGCAWPSLPNETGVVADTTEYSKIHDLEVPMSRIVPKAVRRLLEEDLAYSEPLTRAYLEWLYKFGDLPARVQAELGELLTD